MDKIDAKFTKLVEIIIKLRQPEGCPWDRKQTVATFRPYLVEELHELLEAIDLDDRQLIKEELGDLLFQLIFLNNLYEEEHSFTLAEVLDGITEKMIRRHPHVFGAISINSEKELRKNWNRIKSSERAEKGQISGSIFSYPRTMPALMRAQRVSTRAVSSGFEWSDIDEVMTKLDEEIAELREALARRDRAGIVEEIGDLLFTMVNVARKTELDAEATLQTATDKFIRRFTRMTELATAEGSSIENLDLPAMHRLWTRTKKEE
jgi:MazG family protein